MQRLAETARVVINQDGIARMETKPLTSKEKRARREHLIIEHIRDNQGRILASADFQRVAKFPTPQAAYSVIQRMLREEKIVQVERGNHGYMYAVNDRAAKKVEAVAKAPETKAQIKQKAMEYVWEHPHNAGAMRNFIEWLEAK